MQTIFEALGDTYRQVGDYLLPDIEVPGSPQISIWVQRMNNIRNWADDSYNLMLKTPIASISPVPSTPCRIWISPPPMLHIYVL